MPIQYPQGIIQEHLSTRKAAGLFDVSHMGRFIIQGKDALPFLQHVLSNNAAGLETGESQYTLIPNASGGAIDDAYLYRFYDHEYLLVVNAANRFKDWEHLRSHTADFQDLTLLDRTDEIAMLSLQGPLSKNLLLSIIDDGPLPEPMRNRLSRVRIKGADVLLARTGYTGEPICFELFVHRPDTHTVWDLLIEG
ncbi:MAG: glycine cleavage system protein T, partial [Deltaproteobacteria bacterium]